MRNSFPDYRVFRTMHTEEENKKYHFATTRRGDLFWSGADWAMMFFSQKNKSVIMDHGRYNLCIVLPRTP